MQAGRNVEICQGEASGAIRFERTLAASENEWANRVSLLTGRTARAHGSRREGEAVRALADAPSFFAGLGYACETDWAETPFVFHGGAGKPLFAYRFAPSDAADAIVVRLEQKPVRRPEDLLWRMSLDIPGLTGTRVVRKPVSIVDVFSTLCALLGAEIPAGAQGRALQPLMGLGASADEREFRWATARFGQSDVLASEEGLFVYDDEGLRRVDGGGRAREDEDDALLALAAAKLRALDPMPIPRNRYRVKRHPLNCWFDGAFCQTEDPGVVPTPPPTDRPGKVAPISMEEKR